MKGERAGLIPKVDSADYLVMSDLERADAGLRGALRIAAKRIQQLTFGKRHDPVWSNC